MNLEALNPDKVEDVFRRYGAHSITLTDAGDQPVLEPVAGETPLWSDTRITGLFSAESDLESLQDDLKSTLDLDTLPPHRIEVLADRAWEREWLKDFGPMRFGKRLWVCPGITETRDSDAVIVQMDPGLAFGTGTHATTAMCLEWLDGFDLEGCSILDYGCGSGILAIAALKLGCRKAVAIDIDPQATVASRQNAMRNGVADRLTVHCGENPAECEFDIVIANILAGPLVELAKSVTGQLSTGGTLVLSGILQEQAGDVLDAYAPWIDFDSPAVRSQDRQTWVRLHGQKGRQ